MTDFYINDDMLHLKHKEMLFMFILFLTTLSESHHDIVPTLWSVNFTMAPGQTKTQ